VKKTLGVAPLPGVVQPTKGYRQSRTKNKDGWGILDFIT